MALGRRPNEQQEAWVATTDLPRSPGHPFYGKLNEVLAEAGFDRWAENLCAPYYAKDVGRPSIPPGVYFRMVFIGYFEGIASQRGIAWRCSDSLSLRAFLGLPLTEATPEHSSMTRVQQRLPQEVHEEVFRFMLKIAADKKLLHGKTTAVDSTTLEANAAMKSIVRKDTGEDYQAYLRRLAAEDGLADLSDEELRRYDKNRPNKRVSNEEWESTTDPDSHITKMKDGTTHLAYKAEHVVDVKTDFVLAATVHSGTVADTATLVDSVVTAQANLDAAHGVQRERTADADKPSPQVIHDVTADTGYHDDGTLADCQALGLRTYIPESTRHEQRRWTDKPPEYRAAVYANRRRLRGKRSKKLQRQRSELTERTFAHVCETGSGRRCWLRGLAKVTKRYLLQVAARNLGLILRKLFGIGTARSLQGSRALSWLIHFVRGWLTVWRAALETLAGQLRHSCVTHGLPVGEVA